MLWPSANRFWKWFKDNNKTFLDLPSMGAEESLYWLKQLNAQLRLYHRSLNSAIVLTGGDTNLAISVNSRKRYFKKAEALVARAPVIPGWSFKALLQPGMLGDLVNRLSKEAGIDPAEFRFSFLIPDSTRGDLTIFHPSYRRENKAAINKLVYHILLNILGERFYANYIRSIEFANISEADPDSLEELESLPIILKGGFVINTEGNLTGAGFREK